MAGVKRAVGILCVYVLCQRWSHFVAGADARIARSHLLRL